jgi:lauroyl/myristoyl acyltransferase
MVAKVLALSLVVLPEPGMSIYWSMRQAFGESRLRSFQLAWEWLRRPFLDFVMLKRVWYGREDVSKWRIVEQNSDEVARLRETGESFIVATGHFQRVALLATACPRLAPGNWVQVGLPPPSEIRSLNDWRIRLQYGTMLDVLSSAWSRSFEYAFTKSSQSTAMLLYERLRKPGNIVSIHVDAPWPQSPTGSYARSFAGLTSRDFSTGAAQLASLAQCPIVSCVYWQEDDGTLVLRWGSPIQPADNEIDTMNRLIDTLEVAIGERPTQYVLYTGCDRRWNATTKRWEDFGD